MEQPITTQPPKGKRLSKKGSVIVMLFATILGSLALYSFGYTYITTASVIAFVFAFISIFTEKGLRWL